MDEVVKITVNNQELPCLKDYDSSAEPLWGDNTGRLTDDGHFSGTFVGYFTNLDLTFNKTTQAQLTRIKQLIEKPIITLTYPIETTGGAFTEQFYGTAIKVKKQGYRKKYEGFTISLKAVDRRLSS